MNKYSWSVINIYFYIENVPENTHLEKSTENIRNMFEKRPKPSEQKSMRSNLYEMYLETLFRYLLLTMRY